MKNKYTAGLTLYEMAKYNQIDKKVLNSFLCMASDPINPNTLDADHVESVLYQKPLNKRQKKRKVKQVELVEIITKIKSLGSPKPSFLTKLVDDYFQMFVERKITARELGQYTQILANIEKRMVAGECFYKIMKSMGADSIEEIESDRKFYKMSYKNGLLSDSEMRDIQTRLRGREANLFGGKDA